MSGALILPTNLVNAPHWLWIFSWKVTERSWLSESAPPRCKFFIWLASLNQCWTTDRLARRGLDHPDHCPLCDQEDETIQHILTSCVFAREIWFRVLSLVGLQQLTPSQDDLVFQEWWRLALTRVLEQQQKGFNSLVILVAWWLWKHRNACVFDRTPPPLVSLKSSKISKRRPTSGVWLVP